jgi:hypothetical protein
MSNRKLTSEELKQKMMFLAGTTNINESVSKITNKNSKLLYHKKLADGRVYGIIQECQHYFVKVNSNPSENISVNDFAFIGGVNNALHEKFNSYFDAKNRINGKSISLNEAYGTYNVLNEECDKCKEEKEEEEEEEVLDEGKSNKFIGNELKYNGKVITQLKPSGYFEVYSDDEGKFLKFDNLEDAKSKIDSESVLDENIPLNKDIDTKKVEAPVEAPSEVPVDASSEEPVEAPSEEPVDAPVDALSDMPMVDATDLKDYNPESGESTPSDASSDDEESGDTITDIQSLIGKLTQKLSTIDNIEPSLAKTTLNSVISATKTGIAQFTDKEKEDFKKRIETGGEKLDEEIANLMESNFGKRLLKKLIKEEVSLLKKKSNLNEVVGLGTYAALLDGVKLSGNIIVTGRKIGDDASILTINKDDKPSGYTIKYIDSNNIGIVDENDNIINKYNPDNASIDEIKNDIINLFNTNLNESDDKVSVKGGYYRFNPSTKTFQTTLVNKEGEPYPGEEFNKEEEAVSFLSASSLNESDEDVLKDSNGKIIGIGDIVRTSQEGGGVLAPSEPTVGEVVMRNGKLCVKYRKEGRDFDQYISLLGQNNKIVIKKLNEDDTNTESDEDLVSKAERSISEYKNKAKLSNGKEYYNRAFSNVKALRDINRSQFDILLRKLNSILSDNRDSLNEDNSIDNTYTHFAVRKSDNKIVNGWEYKDIDNESIKEYVKIDLKNDFPNNKLSDFKIVTKKSLENTGMNPFDTKNWYKIEELSEEENIESVPNIRKNIKVTFNNGDSLSTEINGSEDEIKKYYIGKDFNLGIGGKDKMVKATNVEFL